MRPPRAKKLENGTPLDTSSSAQAKPSGDKLQTSVNQRTTTRGVTRAPMRTGSESPTYSPRMRTSNSQSLRRKRPAPVDAESDEDQGTTQDSPATCTSANHNKYCHFCQHVKVRASSMLACENQECCRRFCEHCLLTHLKEDVDPMSSDAWSMTDGKPVWHCPICRTKCCCSVTQCEENHRHCKAYRYRRRRAELATKRMTAAASHAAGEKRGKKGGSKASTPKSSANNTPTLARPTMTLARNGETSQSSGIDSPPIQPASTEAFPVMARPRREAALKRRNYALNDDDDNDDDTQAHGTEASTPGSEECHQPVQHVAHAQQVAHALSNQHVDTNSALERNMWDAEHARHGSAMHTESNFRSEEEEEEDDHFMLGGIYGHMSHFSTDENRVSLDMCGDEMLLDDIDTGTAELDEARWLRKTYETVYNPSARQRALQALTGEAHKAKSAKDISDAVDTPPASAANETWSYKHPQTHSHVACDSEHSFYLQPVQPKAMWESSPSATRKCTVLYDYV